MFTHFSSGKNLPNFSTKTASTLFQRKGIGLKECMKMEPLNSSGTVLPSCSAVMPNREPGLQEL